MTQKKCRNIIKLSLLNLIFIIICFLALVPIIYALTLSFRSSGGAFSGGLFLSLDEITLENYKAILTEQPFLIWLKNSLILSVGTVIVAMGLAITAAYAFSRFRFAGRIQVLYVLLLLNAFPQILSMFAMFRLFKTLNLLNSQIGLILLYAGSMCIFSIWNLKGYFDTIPLEIEEASKIDGASELQTLFKVIFPLARPAIIVTSVMVFIYVWNEYLFATTFMLDPNNYTLAGGLYLLQTNDYNRSWSMFTAAAVIVSIPILIMFFSIQKYMVSGLTEGGVKG